MKGKTVFLAVCVAAFGATLSAETWKNVSLIDSQCVDKVKATPDKHTVKCALACEDGGYGILTADGKFLKFDAAGNEKAAWPPFRRQRRPTASEPPSRAPSPVTRSRSRP